jgi:outer membrane protein assembly factor BamD (BamD/ComL family)
VTRDGLEAERSFLLRSLVDLDAELAAGDVDQHDYITLKDGYTARAAAVLRALDRLDGSPTPVPSPSPSANGVSPSEGRRAPPRRPPRRWVAPVVGTVVVVCAVGAGVFVANNSGQRLPGNTLTGAVTPTGPEAELAQARQDLSDGKYLDAVKTYDAIIRQDPKNPEALAYRGWILRLTGNQANDPSLVDRGLMSVRAAESADPSYPDAHFFAGEILLRDKADGPGAVSEFKQFLADSPPQALVPEVQGELRAAQAVVSSSPSSVAP